jgi:hypothetical protein
MYDLDRATVRDALLAAHARGITLTLPRLKETAKKVSMTGRQQWPG